MLYRWRSLETTVRIRLKIRGRSFKFKTWEHQRTPYSREHLSIRVYPKASIPTLKPSSTQEPTSSRARHTTQILQQRRNIAQSFNYRLPKVMPNSQISQNSLLATSLHSREKKSSSTYQNTDASFLNQKTLTSHSSNTTHREKPP